jgi:hypothetical protein
MKWLSPQLLNQCVVFRAIPDRQVNDSHPRLDSSSFYETFHSQIYNSSIINLMVLFIQSESISSIPFRRKVAFSILI